MAGRISDSESARSGKQSLLRFGMVGLVSTGMDVLILTGVQTAFMIPVWMANVLSYGSGIVINFALNRRWTFQLRSRDGVWGQLFQFICVSLSGLCINTLLVYILEPVFSNAGFSEAGYLPAKAAATCAAFIWNYSMNRSWTFRQETKVSI